MKKPFSRRSQASLPSELQRRIARKLTEARRGRKMAFARNFERLMALYEGKIAVLEELQIWVAATTDQGSEVGERAFARLVVRGKGA